MKYIVFALGLVTLLSCSLFEDIENKSYLDQTIELLADGGTWKVDSLVRWKFTPATGVTDSLFLNYGTVEFQTPDNPKCPVPNGGFMIHRYTKKGVAKVDTLAWVPEGAGAREPDPAPLYAFFIWYEDPAGQPTYLDDLMLGFNFRTKEKNKVNVAASSQTTQSGIVVAEYQYSYHLTR
jgi:hypothetical protein